MNSSKACSMCNIIKLLTDFNKQTMASDGHNAHCRDCDKVKRIIRIEQNTTDLATQHTITEKQCGKCLEIKETSQFGKDTAKPDGLRYMCIPCLKSYRQKPKIKKQRVEYRKKTYDQWAEWYYSETVTERRNINQIAYKGRRNELMKLRYKNNIGVRLRNLIRARIYCSLQSDKIYSTIEYLGCSIAFLKLWLEYRFESGMTWENIGSVWEIDHILPVCKFDYTNPKSVEICFHWTNLQPLFKKENRKKSGRLEVYYYFNNIVNICRFNSKFKQFLGYQTACESLLWLRDNELRDGKNAPYESKSVLLPIENEMDNPQPSSSVVV